MTKSFWKSIVFVMALTLSPFSLAQNELSRPLTTNVSVTGQMDSDKFQKLLHDGFKSVIVNRPDEEQGNLVSVSELRAIAENSQVNVIYQPVISGQMTQANIKEFAQYYNELPKPILMVCRSGSRSTALFNAAKAQGLIDE